jgi:large subunit ribosomal protein L23
VHPRTSVVVPCCQLSTGGFEEIFSIMNFDMNFVASPNKFVEVVAQTHRTRMSTKTAGAAAKAVADVAAQLPRNFNRGANEVYLCVLTKKHASLRMLATNSWFFSHDRPNHVITLIRPKPKQSPKLATFAVPLQFNKLDLRDYLYHVYNVRITGVRSFINQQAPVRKGGFRGRWYRPRPQKMMIADLEKPFVWPEPPAEDARQDFDHDVWKRVEAEREDTIAAQDERAGGGLQLLSEIKEESKERKDLRSMAEAYLSGKEMWSNNSKLDPTWEALAKKGASK